MSFATVWREARVLCSRSTARIVVAALLVLAASVTAVIQQRGDALLEEMRPTGCEPASLDTLTPNPWSDTSALDIARAVESWQLHTLEAAGEPVEPVALCAGRHTIGGETGGLDARRFTSPRHVYRTQLGVLSTVQVVLTAAALLAAGWASRRRVPLSLTAGSTLVGAVAWVVERRQLAVLLDRAWTAAVTDGLADPTVLDPALFTLAAHARFVSFAAVVVLLVVAAAPGTMAAARTAIAATKGDRFAILALVATSGFVSFVPQANDAVRRWGPGQTITSFAAAVLLGLVVASTTTRRPTVVDIAIDHERSARVRLVWLLPACAAAATLALAGVAAGARGLLVLAGIVALIAVASLPLADPGARRAVVGSSPPASNARATLIGVVAALPTAALGLVAVRAAATDWMALTEPTTVTTGLAGGAALLAAGPLVAVFASLHHRLVRRAHPSQRYLTASAAALVPIIGGPVAMNGLDVADGDGFATLGAIAVFFWFVAAILVALVLLRSLGDVLLAHPRWWRSALPPALVALGVRRSPFPAVVALWILLLPVVGTHGYHDVELTARGGSEFGPPLRRSIDQVAEDWVDRQDVTGPRAVPALTIASSGGGIRAAYWTAAVLDCLVDGESVGDDPCAGRATPEAAERRRDSLVLLSGVSGGSVGLVSYVAQVDEGWRAAGGAQRPRWYERRLGADFQAAVLTHLVTDDLLEFFLRTGEGPDRARRLELAFERRWPDGELSRGFLTGQASSEPYLHLAGYSAIDGCGFNLSILDADGGQVAGSCAAAPDRADPLLHGTEDLADFLCGDDDIRRSTVAVLSARFPYVTPSGRLRTEECHRRPAVAHVVDGGYRGSSGAAAVADLWPELRSAAIDELVEQAPGACLVSLHVQIDSREGRPTTDADAAPIEAILPLLAVGRVGPGVDLAARSSVRSLFDETRHFSIRPVAHPGDEAPLGWTLSETARADLQDQLRTNLADIEAIRHLLDHPDRRDCEPRPPLAPTQET